MGNTFEIAKPKPQEKGDIRFAEVKRLNGFCPKCRKKVFAVQTVKHFRDVYGREMAILKHWCPDHNIILQQQMFPVTRRTDKMHISNIAKTRDFSEYDKDKRIKI